VSDIDLQALLRFHRAHGKLATITAVRPPSRFGGLEFDGDLVRTFTEKPQTGEGWINGGFFVFEPPVLDLIGGDAESLELDVLPRLVARGQLAAYRHDKFWQCMDTLRDKRYLESLWNEGRAPWRAA
jgi:glucose-1-phosphate cytidylyltransferase